MATFVIQKEKILHNLDTLRREVRVPVIPVLKGNAYGLGDVEVAKLLAGQGVGLFAVSRIEEARRLRPALGNDREILLLSPYSTQAQAQEILSLGLTAAVGSYDSAVLLNGLAKKANVKCRVHIAFDTGMGRFGFLPEETDKAVQAAKYLENLEVAGCFSHFSYSFGREKYIHSQLNRFTKCVDALQAAGVNPGLVHIANSAAAIRCPAARICAVRVGSALLGRAAVKNKLGLERVGRLDCEIEEVRWLPSGHNIGYGNVYRTKKPMKIAVIPVGYADGLFAETRRDTFRFRDILRYGWNDFKQLFSKPSLSCMIKGRRAHLVGRVGMCSVIVDVSEIDCRPGDLASFDINPIYLNANVERRYE